MIYCIKTLFFVISLYMYHGITAYAIIRHQHILFLAQLRNLLLMFSKLEFGPRHDVIQRSTKKMLSYFRVKSIYFHNTPKHHSQAFLESYQIVIERLGITTSHFCFQSFINSSLKHCTILADELNNIFIMLSQQ